MIDATLEGWHRFVAEGSAEQLAELLADDVVFHSPIIHTPQRGREVTTMYVTVAAQLLLAGGFRYTKQVVDGDVAVLEFETTVDGKDVNGVDIIRVDGTGRIVELTVMLRPLQGIDAVRRQMRRLVTAARA